MGIFITLHQGVNPLLNKLFDTMHPPQWMTIIYYVLAEVGNEPMLAFKLFQQYYRSIGSDLQKSQLISGCFLDKMLYFYPSYLGVFKSVVFVCNYLKINTLHPNIPPPDEFFGLIR